MTEQDQKAIIEARRRAMADLREKALENLKAYLVPGVILTVEQCAGTIHEYVYQGLDELQQIIARPTKDTAALEEIADEDLDLYMREVSAQNIRYVNRIPLDALGFFPRIYPAPTAADSWNTFQGHAAWSEKTFGHNRGPIGPLKHLKKEAQEAMDAPDDISEFADCQLLVWDATRRAGFTHDELIAGAADKLAILKTREYPKVEDGQPSFHVKPGGAGEPAGQVDPPAPKGAPETILQTVVRPIEDMDEIGGAVSNIEYFPKTTSDARLDALQAEIMDALHLLSEGRLPLAKSVLERALKSA